MGTLVVSVSDFIGRARSGGAAPREPQERSTYLTLIVT